MAGTEARCAHTEILIGPRLGLRACRATLTLFVTATAAAYGFCWNAMRDERSMPVPLHCRDGRMLPPVVTKGTAGRSKWVQQHSGSSSSCLDRDVLAACATGPVQSVRRSEGCQGTKAGAHALRRGVKQQVAVANGSWESGLAEVMRALEPDSTAHHARQTVCRLCAAPGLCLSAAHIP
jgi:hypothetical protein